MTPKSYKEYEAAIATAEALAALSAPDVAAQLRVHILELRKLMDGVAAQRATGRATRSGARTIRTLDVPAEQQHGGTVYQTIELGEKVASIEVRYEGAGGLEARLRCRGCWQLVCRAEPGDASGVITQVAGSRLVADLGVWWELEPGPGSRIVQVTTILEGPP